MMVQNFSRENSDEDIVIGDEVNKEYKEEECFEQPCVLQKRSS